MFDQLRRLDHGDHAVEFYDSDEFLVECVENYVAAALASGDTAIVVATEDHRRAVADALAASGIDVAAAVESGRYIALDARETLSRFLVGDVPDPTRFRQVVGGLIAGAGLHRGVAVYGEMVALLWAEGRAGTAIALEDAESYSGLTDQGEQHRLVAVLQQAARLAAVERACAEVDRYVLERELEEVREVARGRRRRRRQVAVPRHGEGRAARLLGRVRGIVPRGGMLPPEVWARCHRGVLALVALHLPVIALYAGGAGELAPAVVAQLAAVAGLGVLAARCAAPRHVLAPLASVALLTCSSLFVQVSGGAQVAHLHWFVMVAVVALYHEWAALGAAVVYSVVLNAVLGAGTVSAAGLLAAAAVHGGFTAALAAAGVVTWRLDEAFWSAAVAGERRLGEAQRLAGLGSWEWDLRTGAVSWSGEAYSLLGLGDAEPAPPMDRMLALVHPGDRPRVEAAFAAWTRTAEPFEHDVRVCRPDATVRWLHVQGRVTEMAHGAPALVAGTILDITLRKEAEERLELAALRKDGSEVSVEISLGPFLAESGMLVTAAIRDVTERKRLEQALRDRENQFRTTFEDAPIGMALGDLRAPVTGSWIDVNPAFGRALGYRRTELLGHRLEDFVHPDDLRDLELDRLRSGRLTYHASEVRYRHADGHWIKARVSRSLISEGGERPTWW